MSDAIYERRPNEPSKAWEAFLMYRDMGLSRTLEQVRKSRGNGTGSLRLLERWSGQWKWVERCRAWDHHLEVRSREAAEAFVPIWEQRRQASLQANLDAAAFARGKLLEMMARPIMRERSENVNGRDVTIIEPAGWNWNTVINGLKVVAELEAETIAEGMLETEDEVFDAATASEDELRAYVNKRLNRGRIK